MPPFLEHPNRCELTIKKQRTLKKKKTHNFHQSGANKWNHTGPPDSILSIIQEEKGLGKVVHLRLCGHKSMYSTPSAAVEASVHGSAEHKSFSCKRTCGSGKQKRMHYIYTCTLSFYSRISRWVIPPIPSTCAKGSNCEKGIKIFLIKYWASTWQDVRKSLLLFFCFILARWVIFSNNTFAQLKAAG